MAKRVAVQQPLAGCESQPVTAPKGDHNEAHITVTGTPQAANLPLPVIRCTLLVNLQQYQQQTAHMATTRSATSSHHSWWSTVPRQQLQLLCILCPVFIQLAASLCCPKRPHISIIGIVLILDLLDLCCCDITREAALTLPPA